MLNVQWLLLTFSHLAARSPFCTSLRLYLRLVSPLATISWIPVIHFSFRSPSRCWLLASQLVINSWLVIVVVGTTCSCYCCRQMMRHSLLLQLAMLRIRQMSLAGISYGLRLCNGYYLQFTLASSCFLRYSDYFFFFLLFCLLPLRFTHLFICHHSALVPAYGCCHLSRFFTVRKWWPATCCAVATHSRQLIKRQVKLATSERY